MGGKLEGTGPRDGVSGAKAGGKEIELVIESSDATPDVAVEATRRLVEQNKVDVVVGPLSGDEGLAIKNYAKQHPDVTFVNGTSGAQNTTLRDPAELLPLHDRRRAVDGRPGSAPPASSATRRSRRSARTTRSRTTRSAAS